MLLCVTALEEASVPARGPAIPGPLCATKGLVPTLAARTREPDTPQPCAQSLRNPLPPPMAVPQSPVGKDPGPKVGPGLPKGSARQALNSRVVQSPLGSPGPRQFPAEATGGERRGLRDLYPLSGGEN